MAEREDREMLYDEVLKNDIEDIKKGLNIEDMFAMIQTQRSHIDTLDRILIHIRNTIRLEKECYIHKDYEEMNIMNEELIEFINEVIKEEIN